MSLFNCLYIYSNSFFFPIVTDSSHGAGQWSEQKLEELRTKKESLETELEELDSQIGRGSNTSAAKVEDL